MRLVAAIAVVILALSAARSAVAQSLEDMQACRQITADARRLACYDVIPLVQAPRPKYDQVDLSDLKSYALSYRDQLVEVSGWLKPGSDLFTLGADASDARPVPIDPGSLPRRDRQAFVTACGEGCQATVQGRVKPVNFTTGIVADALVAH
jgi:hypothetical protein